MVVFTLIYFFLLCYAILLIWLASGFLRTHYFKPARANRDVPVTIIISARNEEKNIARCLASILKQHYDLDKLQLIVINDASTDYTVQQANLALQKSGVRFQVISNAVKKGKKESIRYAMQFVENELVVVRDADTFSRSNFWLGEIVDFYRQTNAQFIIGPVALADNDGLLWAMQAVENNILAVIACGSAFYDRAFLCNGANMAFTRTCFIRVNGYASHLHIASGDDVLFLADVRKQKSIKIGYLKSAQALVYTFPERSLKSLIAQKVRWAAKFRHNPGLLNSFLAVMVFFVNLSWIFCFITANYWSDFKKTCLLFIFIKLSIDILLLFLSAGFIKNRKLIWYALPVSCIYPVYAIIIGVASAFLKPKWK
jgi:cellulose synthase/poly-beta-1,6-N-acetylglucosamine synthase-like glycosyltransferase